MLIRNFSISSRVKNADLPQDTLNYRSDKDGQYPEAVCEFHIILLTKNIPFFMFTE